MLGNTISAVSFLVILGLAGAEDITSLPRLVVLFLLFFVSFFLGLKLRVLGGEDSIFENSKPYIEYFDYARIHRRY